MFNYLSAFIIPPLHPLMPGTVFCILGIICAYFLPIIYTFYFLVLIIIIGLMLLFCCFIYKNMYSYTSLLCICLFAIGFYRYHIVTHNYKQLKKQLVHTQAHYTGILQNIEQTAHNYYKYSLTLRITSIECNKQLLGINPGYLLKFYYNTCNNSKILVPGTMITVPSTIKYSTDTFEKYLLKESLLAHVFTKYFDYKSLTTTYSLFPCVIRLLAHTQNRIIQNLKAQLSPLTYTLFSSLFLGAKPTHEHYRQSIKIACTQWGIIHYLARSGLHIVLIITLWSMIIAACGLPYYIKQVLLIVIIVLYYIFTWPSISFIRAFVTFMLSKLCLFTNRPVHSFYAVTLTCLIVVIYNPLQLFFLDFQLSFGLTAALAWFNEVRIHKYNTLHKTLEVPQAFKLSL